MMKRILSLTLALCLLALPVLAEPAADAFTTASVYNFYGKIEGDELLNAINSHSGFYAVSTVNPDGTPNIAFFIYSCVKLDGTYYLMLGLNPNQTTANIDNGSEVAAMYGQLPADMETVETQQEDVPRDMKCYKDSCGNVYDFAFGLNWSGVIRDGRVQKYL